MNKIHILLFLIFPLMVAGQTEWELEKVKNGIKVYTRHVSWSDYKETRGVTEVNVPVESCVAFLLDMEVVPEWVYGAKTIDILEKMGDTVIVYWLETKAPWPYRNRDAVYHQRLRWDTLKSCVRVDIVDLPDVLPEKEHLVRLPKAKGYWEMTPLDIEKTRLEFVMHVEPGSAVPAWLANVFVVNSPYDSMFNLMNIIYRDDYQNKHFDFIPDR